MSSRQPNMANMAQRNTQQGAAHQQNQNGLGQMQQNQNQMTGGFTSPFDNTNNNTNSGSPMVVGPHHFNPQRVQNSSSTPNMASGNPSFESFTQSQTPFMSTSQNQFLGNMQDSVIGNAQMPFMNDPSMQPPFFHTPPMGNVQAPFMSDTQASAMNDSQGFVQQTSGLRATAPSFTPAQSSPVPQQSAASMANMQSNMTPQMHAHMQRMKMRINQQQAIINSMMRRQSGSSAQSKFQHGPALQTQQRMQQRNQTPTTQVPSPRASTPGTAAAQVSATQPRPVPSSVTQDPIAQFLSVQPPIAQNSTNEPVAAQSPTAVSPTTESSGSQGGNTMQTAPALSANPNSMTERGSRVTQRDSSLTQVSRVMNTNLAMNPRTRLLPQDVRPHAPPPPQHKLKEFLVDGSLKVVIPNLFDDQPPTAQTSPTKDSSAEEPSTPASSNGFSSFEDWSKAPVYAPGLFAPRRSDGPEKLTPKEKKLREAEDNGEQIFPSKRRVVRIDPEDPRLIRDENGLPITPQGDCYNIYYLPGPKKLDAAELNRMLIEIRTEKKTAMDEAAKTGEPIQNSKSTKRTRKSKTTRQTRVLKTPSENIVNKKRRKSTTTATTTISTTNVAGDAQLATTLGAQPSLNNGPIAQASNDPFTIQSNTALPAPFAGGDAFNRQLSMSLFPPQVILDSDFTQSFTAGITQPPTTGGNLTLQLAQESSFTSQTTNEQPTANLLGNDFASQPFNPSDDSALQPTEDFTNTNDHSFEILADLDPMFVDTRNTPYEDLPLDTEPFAQFSSTQSGSSQSPSTPVSDSGAAKTLDHDLSAVVAWLVGHSEDASAVTSQDQLAQIEVNASMPHVVDPSLSVPVLDIFKTCHPDLSLRDKDTLSEPFDGISMFPQDDEQGTQLRRVSNELDRPLPEQADITVFVADIPNPYNRDLDAERAGLTERFRAGGELNYTDRSVLMLITGIDSSIDVDAVNRQTAGVTEGMSPADIPVFSDDVPLNIFASLEDLPENNLQDPSATTGNDNTMFPVAGCSDFNSSNATGPASTWPPAAPNVSLADMPYSPVVASQETQDAPFQPPQGPEFHPQDPYKNLFEGVFLNPAVLNQTTTTTLPTSTTTTNTTKTGNNKRKAGEDASAAPKKKARTKKALVPQLALPQCEVRFGPGAQQ
ncbi:hypothetical protein BFJ66_g12263 [Fusarium oxysporum f. sp. cepae]|uniref:Uncharacterized protein n=4 Tax=Fusarium oxysporum f. sp. cepae TaxID=396571 RepID=A0A3L6N690_FUSOX|nr:hypothetical protein BFJ65_g12347 [Fusarium oxysporum f. sp. cepae]RKK37127.1 hypothetical protein BFJ67_g12490 [Fusarium oxysporum f. sp. cepae]RKK38885.1 hypothetical protein BFJ66_g12263 [Fusarium oxysporum f. sp. cepae]